MESEEGRVRPRGPRCASFDIDGVINMGAYPGVYPGPNDILITGRSFEERPETEALLEQKGLSHHLLFMNTVPFEEKTRRQSGIHKGETIAYLNSCGYNIVIHFEDDPIQMEEIKKLNPDLPVVLLKHDLTEKENVRHSL